MQAKALPAPLWLLRLVPSVRHGRWLAAAVILVAMLIWMVVAELASEGPLSWNIAAFFAFTIAYMVPVFHYITAHTERAFDDLAPHLSIEPGRLAKMRATLSRKPPVWVTANLTLAVSLWLLQSRLLAGSGTAMIRQFTIGFDAVTFVVAPLIVWLTITCALHALIDNARLFRHLARSVRIDLLDTSSVLPFGRMAVSSTLVVLGSLATLGIMWIGPRVDPWTTIPGMVLMLTALVFLFFAPVLPVHRALVVAKRAALADVQADLGATRNAQADYATLAPMLAYRREVLAVPEWPFDTSTFTSLGLYVVIVPLAWIGAALVEIVVDAFVS